MPNVRDSSGTIGTMCLPSVLSRSSICRICTNAIVVEISRSSVLFRNRSNAASSGIAQRLGLAPARRQVAAELHPPRAHVLELRRAVVELDVRHFLELVVGDRNVEAVAEAAERLDVHLLLLVRDVLRLAGDSPMP